MGPNALAAVAAAGVSIFHAGDRLVVPDLQLGAESVPNQRV
jgi:hypothetical protein